MRLLGFCASIVGISLFAGSASADYQFITQSTATQTITSPLVAGGSIVLDAAGSQEFTIDPVGGTANVVSDFKGTDFETVVGTFNYKLYNTATVGTVTTNNGQYTVTFSLLFELKIVGGLLDGVTFETLTNATFTGTFDSIPFPDNSVFGDPNRPDDAVAIFLKSDPNGVLGSIGVGIGDPVGTSSNRVVTALRPVPEPSALASCAFGLGLVAAFGLRGRRRLAK